jgi:hypothetical protein
MRNEVLNSDDDEDENDFERGKINGILDSIISCFLSYLF